MSDIVDRLALAVVASLMLLDAWWRFILHVSVFVACVVSVAIATPALLTLVALVVASWYSQQAAIREWRLQRARLSDVTGTGQLRALVRDAWMEATDDQEYPSSALADDVIEAWERRGRT